MAPPKDPKKYDEWIKHLSEAHKGTTLSEEHKKKLSVLFSGENNPQYGKRGKDSPNFGVHRSEETRKRQSEAAKGKPKSEEHKKHLSESHKEIFIGQGNPFYGKKHTDESKLLMSVAHAGVQIPIETRMKQSEVHKKRCADPLVRINMSERQMGDKSHHWQGGISFEPYCQKFNRPFKERVRTFFNNQCVVCGTQSIKPKLSVHHVNYNKQACCDNSPAVFATLCRPCHGKTNKNKEVWIPRITDIINTKYNGKSYLTKEEMKRFRR